MRKLFLVTAIAVVVSFALPVAAFAVPCPGDPNVRVAKFWVGKAYYEVNGQRFQMDVAPYVKNGRTLLPLRFVGYALSVQEKDVTWNGVLGEATLKRWHGEGQYDYDEVTFRTKPESIKRFGDYDLNGWSYTAKLDVSAEVAPPGRVMIPFRAAVHALGGLAFWDGKERCVTVVTWEKPPKPVKQKVKKVEIPKHKPEATVMYLDGKTEKVVTEQPVYIGPTGRYMLDAIGYFKLWGVPEEAMLFDPVRGGLIVRGAATHNNPLDGMDRQTTTYVSFYAGEKQSWDGFFKRYPTDPKEIADADPMYVESGTLYGDDGVGGAPWYLWGGTGRASFSGTGDNKVLTVTVE